MKEGKINKDGFLEIKRAGYFVPQNCCSISADDCGHGCSQFGEPLKYPTGEMFLEICQNKTLVFSKFTDER